MKKRNKWKNEEKERKKKGKKASTSGRIAILLKEKSTYVSSFSALIPSPILVTTLERRESCLRECGREKGSM